MPDTNEPTEATPDVCPFCGGKAHLVGDRLRGYWVECISIYCFGPHTSKYGVKAEAIAAWNRRVAPAPSFVVGIEAAAKVAIELGTAPLEGANIRIGIGNAIAAAIRALAHNPQASSGGDSNKQAVEFVARWAWREPSNPDKPISDAERLSAIKYHPTIKAAWSGAAEGNAAEAAAPSLKDVILDAARHVRARPAGLRGPYVIGDEELDGIIERLGPKSDASGAPKPDPAIAELAKPDWYSDGFQIKSIPFNDNGLEAAGLYTEATVQRIVETALTASNDHVAELERERDEANRDRVTWAYNAGHSADELLRTQRALKAAERERDAAFKLAHEWAARAGGADVRAEAAEAEVSRLKAGAVTDEMVEAAARAIWLNLCGDIRQTPADVVAYSDAARAALEAALSNQVGARK